MKRRGGQEGDRGARGKRCGYRIVKSGRHWPLYPDERERRILAPDCDFGFFRVVRRFRYLIKWIISGKKRQHLRRKLFMTRPNVQNAFANRAHRAAHPR